MNKQQFAFLCGGLAFGFLFGFSAYHVFWAMPGKSETGGVSAVVPAPAGPPAMNQAPPTGTGSSTNAAPMVAEINALKKRLQEDPRDLAAATRLAHLHHDVKMWAQAIEFYAAAIEISPEDPDLLTDKGVCHQEIGEFELALQLFDRAQQAAPDHWQSLYNKAVVLGFRLGRFDEASEVLGRLETNRPDLDVQGLRQALEEARARG